MRVEKQAAPYKTHRYLARAFIAQIGKQMEHTTKNMEKTQKRQNPQADKCSHTEAYSTTRDAAARDIIFGCILLLYVMRQQIRQANRFKFCYLR